MSFYDTLPSAQPSVARRLLSIALLLGCYGSLAAAQDASTASSADAAKAARRPIRAARLTFFAGAVQVQRSDNTGEDTPALNMPLNEGTRIVTGDYGQVEIEFEDGSVARLTPRSSLALDALSLEGSSVARTRLTLLGGLAYFELRTATNYPFLVDAGGTHASPVENATIRISLDEPPATFAVLTGAAEIERPNGFRAEVRAGESIRADAKDESRYFLNSRVIEESWDHWNQSRDQGAADEADRRTSARDSYAGNQGYGWSDLDANGSWYNVPGEGQIWQPAVAGIGFDPYGYGNWVWSNSGYVWASGYNWGWTPFRCGSWAFYPGFGWGWLPNAGCGGWGYSGFGYSGQDNGGYVSIGRAPLHYNPVSVPLSGLSGVHPILTVHGPDGARPATLRGGPVKLGGVLAQPLRPVGAGSSRSQNALGQTLNRDFPVDLRTHQPILGLGSVSRPAAESILVNALATRPSGSRPPTMNTAPTSTIPVHPGNSEALRSRPATGVLFQQDAPRTSVMQPAPAAPIMPPPPSSYRPSLPPPVRTLAPIPNPTPAPIRISPPPPPAPAPVRMSPPPPPAPVPMHITPSAPTPHSEPSQIIRPKL